MPELRALIFLWSKRKRADCTKDYKFELEATTFDSSIRLRLRQHSLFGSPCLCLLTSHLSYNALAPSLASAYSLLSLLSVSTSLPSPTPSTSATYLSKRRFKRLTDTALQPQGSRMAVQHSGGIFSRHTNGPRCIDDLWGGD